MKNFSARAAFISVAAIAGAMAWGAVEVLALQWSSLIDRLPVSHRMRASD